MRKNSSSCCLNLQSPFGVHWKTYDEAQRAELSGWTERDGRTDGNQKCSLNFYVLKYINKHVLWKFSRSEKIVNEFMGLIFGFEVGGGEGGTIFEITLGTWISTYVVSNWTIFCGVFFLILIIVLSMRKVMFEDINSYAWAKNGYNSCLRKITKSYCLTLQSLLGVHWKSWSVVRRAKSFYPP